MTSTSVELPPRRLKENQEMTILRNQSSLEIMVQMGFPKQRVEKALAATGDKGVQLASDWLLAHVNDPKLDDACSRDYILYLCPVGQLQQEFLDFWQKSYQECGWNKAHNYFPHMTLSSFFQMGDKMVSQLSHALKVVTGRVKNAPECLEFELFSSAIYIGLFATDKYESFLEGITADFAEEMKKVGVEVDTHKKQLHVSLAYHYALDKHKKLDALSRSINLKAAARWDLRIYSRAQTEPNCQVRRVLFSYTSAACDEIDLSPGDFILAKEIGVSLSEDGWCLGTSWLTGCSGMFPLVYTERTAETETWTMHKSIPIIGTDLNVDSDAVEEENLTTLRSSRYLPTGSAQPTSYATMPASLSYQHSPIQSSAPLANIKSSSSSLLSSTSLVTSASLVSSSSTSSAASHASLSSAPQGVEMSGVAVEPTPSESKVVRPPIAIFTTKNKASVIKNHSPTEAPMATNHSANPSNQPISGTKQHCPTSNASSSDPHTSSGSVHNPLNSPLSINTFCRTPAIDTITSSLPVASLKGARQLYVVKHGESINSTFGKDWIQNSFNQSGKYTRYDLNIPKAMPKRRTGPEEFANDSPLTVQGCFQSKLLGEAMREKSVKILHFYASPSLKCIQSVASFLEGLGITPSKEIKVESGLFEWLGCSKQNGLPKFMTVEELREGGYPIDVSYSPICSSDKLFANFGETVEQFYERSYLVTKEILKRHEAEGGSILLMTHGCNLDSCTRKLVGQPCRSMQGFQEIARKIPYCAMCVAQEATVVLDTWYLIEPPVLPFAHSNNPKYNWTSLTTPGLS